LVCQEFCFLELFLCTFGANTAAQTVSAGKWFLFHAALWFVLRALYLVVGRLIPSPLLVTHSIRYALSSSTLLYSSRKRNCLPCFPFSSLNKVQCILCKVLEFWNSVREKHSMVYLLSIKNRMILEWSNFVSAQIAQLDLYFQCGFCDKLQLKEGVFFIFENRVSRNRHKY